MERLKRFFLTSLLGGVVVILPVMILMLAFAWVFNLVTGFIRPLTSVLVARDMEEIVATVLVLAIILVTCFVVGAFVRTRAGGVVFQLIDARLLKAAPGYSLVKDIVLAFLGGKKSPFSTVALVQLFDSDTLTTAFVVDEHANGSFTVFVPTGPNPTSGLIYHVKGEHVHKLDVAVEDAMRATISCGAGSSKLIEAYERVKSREVAEVEV
jgi:uncharacterized membrane protein